MTVSYFCLRLRRCSTTFLPAPSSLMTKAFTILVLLALFTFSSTGDDGKEGDKEGKRLKHSPMSPSEQLTADGSRTAGGEGGRLYRHKLPNGTEVEYEEVEYEEISEYEAVDEKGAKDGIKEMTNESRMREGVEVKKKSIVEEADQPLKEKEKVQKFESKKEVNKQYNQQNVLKDTAGMEREKQYLEILREIEEEEQEEEARILAECEKNEAANQVSEEAVNMTEPISADHAGQEPVNLVEARLGPVLDNFTIL